MEELPKEINIILDTYFHYFDLKLPNLIDSFYLYGSITLGAFKNGFSDIDFIAVVKRDVSDADVKILKKIHKDVQRKFPNTILDGWYILNEDIQSINEEGNLCIRFNDGKYQGLHKFQRNSIDAFQLKKYGITVKGLNIEKVDISVNWDTLLSNMRDNLNSYWISWLNNCKKFPTINYLSLFVSLRSIEWGILGVSRLYYTFKENDITSKVAAGEYVLGAVPIRWHKIINESMRLRTDNKKSYYKSIYTRRKDAIDYVEFMIEECNKLI
ncbi:aminoglycoside adenylyltransferase domain-containing protein [Gottfriedia acidiceleris]|uniref:aminoglycoside adenylyltransferase domain-containing protein n=1 Tax=Gottfriedia acidiceleris TaxID=371036 RepID=UPI000B43C4EB|nr:aminoglycoside adenylyltransferase domain-containing protein [Gottfriedia acidiceleris]